MAIGAAYSYPYGYSAYPGYYYGYPSYYAPPTVVFERSETIYRDRAPVYRDTPDAQDDMPSPACGAWSWDAADDRYHWIPCGAPRAPSASSQPPNAAAPKGAWRPPSEPRSALDPF
jgi:hypothetical protein